jgi:hypothetical protein
MTFLNELGVGNTGMIYIMDNGGEYNCKLQQDVGANAEPASVNRWFQGCRFFRFSCISWSLKTSVLTMRTTTLAADMAT